MALRLPTVTEVVDRIDEADPVLVWQVGGRNQAGLRKYRQAVADTVYCAGAVQC
jgi:hypothetical protein